MLAKLLETLIGGGAQAVSAAITPFTGDKVQIEQARHGEALARLTQFGAEFADRQGRTWWDSFIDGLNRLPRPAMARGVLALFIWASADPAGFAAAAQAWALIPDEMWIVLGAIVTFFFGDRTLLAARRSQGPTVEQVRAVLDSATRIRALAPEPPIDADRYAREMADKDTPLSDAAIREWNRRHATAVPAGS